MCGVVVDDFGEGSRYDKVSSLCYFWAITVVINEVEKKIQRNSQWYIMFADI